MRTLLTEQLTSSLDCSKVNKVIRLLTATVSIFFLLLLPNYAAATANTLPDTTNAPEALPSLGVCTKAGNDLGSVITYLICVIRLYVSAIAVLIIMVVGIMYIIGAFKPDAAGAAKTILNTTIVGLLAMYLISFIINFLVLTGTVNN